MAQSITLSVVSISNDIASTATFSITEPGGATVTPSSCTKADLVSGITVSVDSDTATSLTIVATSGACSGVASSTVTWSVNSSTPTPTPTSTSTPTSTPTSTSTPTPTGTTAPNTNTPTPTGTTAPNTDTPTPTPTNTETPTPTPTNTNPPVTTSAPPTETPTNTPTNTPTSTPSCLTYDIDNYDLGQTITFSYTDCNDGQTKSFTLQADSSYYICSTTTPIRTGGSNSYQVSAGYVDPVCANGENTPPTDTPTPTPTTAVPAQSFIAVYSNNMSSGDLDVCSETNTSTLTVYSNCSSITGVGSCRLYTSAAMGTNYAPAGYYYDANTNNIYYIEQSTGLVESVTQCSATPTPTATPVIVCDSEQLYTSTGDNGLNALCGTLLKTVYFTSNDGTFGGTNTVIYGATDSTCTTSLTSARYYSNGSTLWYWNGGSLSVVDPQDPNYPECP